MLTREYRKLYDDKNENIKLQSNFLEFLKKTINKKVVRYGDGRSLSKMYLSGISGSGKSHYLFRRISEIIKISNYKTPDMRVFTFVKDNELNSFYYDLRSFFNSTIDIFTFPSDDIKQRLFTIDKIKNIKKFIICATNISINSPVPDPKTVDIGITVVQNQKYDLENLIIALSSFGYTSTDFVKDKIQFAIRGDIVDVWPVTKNMPIRILFDYNVIGAIRFFDPETQLSNSFINEVKILPANLLKFDSTIKSYFDSATNNIPECRTSESELTQNVAHKCFNNGPDSVLYFDYPIDKNMEKTFDKYELLINDPLNIKTLYQGYKSFIGFHDNINFFVNLLKSFAENDVAIKIYCSNDNERERIVDIFHENHWNYKKPDFLYGNLSQGFYLENAKIACVSSREMLYGRKVINFPKIKNSRQLDCIVEMSAGDYVVHEKYGIGRYTGLKTISRDNNTSEYLCIEYKNNDKLYVPLEEIKTVKKYIAVKGTKPKLYSMDMLSWERVKSRARKAAAEFAKELLKLYTQRSLVKRKPLCQETPWEKELEDTFPYDETIDQIKAMEDIKNDFYKSYPMERLICGDVGYGKTEVAVRAAFKVVQENMQVAILVPTTVLANQHYNTFYSRLSTFPIKIAVLSRFQTKAQQKNIIKNLESGLVDIIIGTHRLLQKDVKFKRLGLLIIDEEHRFGVRQKEKIKSIKKDIDILMLSATPIPRTLSSALAGFRDLSLIETPPFERLPIETTLRLYNNKLIKNIIETELLKNGQVFYVYNKIETILTKAENIKKLVPRAKLGVIHGRMKTKDIENIMWQFTNLKLDVLLATTIIESGLDIPSVNTMIIEEAENFGLSQLYQLRGRIGRGKEKAYCYLFYKDKTLSDEAIKRLEVMREFSELGSGFKFALRDLEIRGAGGILSESQHGFVIDIGYDMFVKFLDEEGKKIRGDTFAIKEKKHTIIDLQVDALIPNIYIKDENIRILFYRKLSAVKCIKDIEDIKNELLDRFGKIPKEIHMLFEITNLRLIAEKLRIERIAEDRNYIYLYFSQKADFSELDITKFIGDYLQIIEFIPGEYYAFKLKKNMLDTNTIEYLKKFLSRLDFYVLK
ncbi:MAG: transcription-repair coupling factor [Endomicrobium sp.]|jgi:transcription-repair coupling factor (superfamily II helicase)|nr:transcription-repair coupling factor [Endomicrobium sp.]